MKRIAKKHFKTAPSVGECKPAPRRHEIFNWLRARLEETKRTVFRKANELADAREKLEKQMNGAKNYEEWARLQMFDKDNALTLKAVESKELQDRIDWLVKQATDRTAIDAAAADKARRVNPNIATCNAALTGP